ncbi:hypothetical protein LINPERPRIM_LOCUS35304, partial [Linum perenne]
SIFSILNQIYLNLSFYFSLFTFHFSAISRSHPALACCTELNSRPLLFFLPSLGGTSNNKKPEADTKPVMITIDSDDDDDVPIATFPSKTSRTLSRIKAKLHSLNKDFDTLIGEIHREDAATNARIWDEVAEETMIAVGNKMKLDNPGIVWNIDEVRDAVVSHMVTVFMPSDSE